jgi:hypothetical protein
MIRALATGMVLTVLAAGFPAQAQQMAYSGETMGVGSGKCTTYKMNIDVTVNGTAVKALFKQQGREERHFEATMGAGGAIKTKAVVGGGGSMDVTGTIGDKDGRVLLDGYCKFDFKLTRK